MTLTAEEQAAIKAYTGPIQKVPMGHSSEPTAIWDAKENKLRNAHHCGTPYTREDAMKRFKHSGFTAKPETFLRRGRVKELAQTMTALEISVHLNLSPSTIRDDLRRLGVKAKPADRKGVGNNARNRERTAKRRAQIQAAFNAGSKTPSDVGQATGLDRRTCRRDMIAMGLWEGRS